MALRELRASLEGCSEATSRGSGALVEGNILPLVDDVTVKRSEVVWRVGLVRPRGTACLTKLWTKHPQEQQVFTCSKQLWPL